MDICQIATKVISGEQALAAFRVYRTERIFILCDSFLTQSGAIDLLTRQIAPTNQVQVFDDGRGDRMCQVIDDKFQASSPLAAALPSIRPRPSSILPAAPMPFRGRLSSSSFPQRAGPVRK